MKRSHIWQTVHQTPELLALARYPLFLTMLVYAYQGKTIRNSQELFEIYIDQRLSDPHSQGVYPSKKTPKKEQTQHYLIWLAQKMEAMSQTEFLIERIQPDWLNSTERRQFIVLGALILGLILGLNGGLTLGLISGLMGELISGLINGLINGLDHLILISEQLKWSWRQAGNGLLGGLFLGLLSGLMGGLTDRFGQIILISEQLKWSWRQAGDGLLGGLIFGLFLGLSGGLRFGPSGGLISGLFLGLILGLSSGLISGLQSVEIENKTIPNQGIWNSAINAGILGLSGELLWGLFLGMLSGLLYFGLLSRLIFLGLILGLILGLMLWLIDGSFYGGQAVSQHIALRLILHRKGYSPWNYAQFLDHAVKHRFIQRVGGRYRFMHDLLRKHFAQMPLNEGKSESSYWTRGT